MQDLQSLIQQQIGQREAGIARQQQQLEKIENKPKQADLSALMAVADMFGNKGDPSLSKIYQGMKPKDDTMKIQALKQQLMQQQQGLTGDQIRLLTAMNKGGVGGGFNKELQKVRTDASKSDDYKKMRSVGDLQASLKKYHDLVDEKGITGFGMDATIINSAYADLKIKYKEAAKLGALTGPDIGILEEAIAPSTGFKGMLGEGVKGGKEGVLNSIKTMEGTFGSDMDAAKESLSAIYPGASKELMDNVINSYSKNKIGGAPKESSPSELSELSKKYGL